MTATKRALAFVLLAALAAPAVVPAEPVIFDREVQRRMEGSGPGGLRDILSRTGYPLDGAPIGAGLSTLSTLTGVQALTEEFFVWPGALTGVATCTGGWLISDTGTGVVGALAGSTGYGGLSIAAGATDNDCTTVELCGAPFKYVVGKAMWFFARVQLSDADDQEALVGFLPQDLTVNNIDLHSELIALDDGMFFRKAETETAFTFSARKNDAETTAVGSGTLTDATYYIVGFTVDRAGKASTWGGTTFEAMASAGVLGTVPAGTATFPDDVALTLYFEAQSGDTSQSDSIIVDWFFFA